MDGDPPVKRQTGIKTLPSPTVGKDYRQVTVVNMGVPA